MSVLTSGVLVTDTEMTTSLDAFWLDLSDLEGWQSYQDVVVGVPCSQEILNRLLTTPKSAPDFPPEAPA
jgi:hypothetical protein